MILDAHTHLAHFAADGRSPNPGEMDRFLHIMDTCGVERSLLLGPVISFSYTPTADEICRANDQTIGAVEQHPDRFTGLCYVNPLLDEETVLDELNRCVATGPLVGVKLWVAATADDPRLDPLMRRAAELDVLVLQHAWYKGTTSWHAGASTPGQVAELARRHPAVRILMAHLTGGGMRGIRDVADYPNISIDTSGAQPVAGLIEAAVRVLGAERVVFGSDWPVRDVATQLGKFDELPLDRAALDAMLSQNLRRLLGRYDPC